MTAHYGFVRQTLAPGTDYTIAVASGGATTSGGTLWLALHSENRQGVNLAPALTQITWVAGQKIVVTINASARATGEEVFRYVLAGASTNTPANLQQLAYVWAIDPANQTAPEALPLTIELTRNQDMVLGGVSATFGALPASPLDGAMRFVTAGALRYEADNGTWTATTKPFSTYLASTTDSNGARVGCDRPLNQLTSAAIIEPLPYTPDGSLQTSPVRVDFSNGLSPTAGPILPQGTALALQLFVAGQDVTTRFSGKVFVTLLGYLDRATGILNTTPPGTGAALPYSYFQSGTGRLVGSNIQLPRALNRGYAAAYRIALKINADELNATGEPISDGSAVEMLLTPIPPRGFYDSISNITGDLVYQDDALEYLRVLPTASGIERQGGVCTVSDYTSPLVAPQTLGGLAADTALQQIAIDATLGAQITLRAPGDPLLPTEALRALVGTTAGSYTVSPWQSPTAVTLGQNLTVTISHPTAIRSDYPDRIAGTTAEFNVPRIRLFVRLSGTTYELPTPLTVAPSSTETVATITTLSGWTTSPTLPNSSGSPGFGLYGYGTIARNAGGSGSSLVAGSYEVAIAWHYPSPNTRATVINHDPADGCIPEAEGTFSDLFADKGKLYVSNGDTTINYLENKLAAGTGITLAKLNPGANEQIQIIAQNPITIQEEGASLPQRNTINFVGSPVTATDTGTKTQVSIAAYTAFTGLSTGYTPTVANQLHVRTDSTPNLLYRSTGTTLGALTEIGGVGNGGGYLLEYTVVLDGGGALPGQWITFGTNNIGTLDLISGFEVSFEPSNAVTPNSADWILGALNQGAIVRLEGLTSQNWGIYRLNSKLREAGTDNVYYFDSATLLDANGNFTDGETIRVQFLNTTDPFFFNLSYSGSLNLDAVSPYRYMVSCNANLILTLPLAASVPYGALHFKRVDTNPYILTIARNGSDLIDGEATQTLGHWEAFSLHSDGSSNWYIS